MRDYQLEGLTWLACLYEVGLNGILADEMGLGKTVQLISFLAFLREHGTNGPFLILGPLSTVTNWVNEFQRWAPKIPVVMYHGNPQVRGQIRRQQLKGDSKGDKFPVVCSSYEICMRDKKYLANYHWKFIVVVSHCSPATVSSLTLLRTKATDSKTSIANLSKSSSSIPPRVE